MKIGNLLYGGGKVSCASCEAPITEITENWKDHALVRRGPAAEQLSQERFGEAFRLEKNDSVEVAEFFCPECEDLLSVELYLAGEEFRRDFRSLESAREDGYDPVREYRNEPESWVSF
jgi:acetone carboxylase gamma subunit